MAEKTGEVPTGNIENVEGPKKRNMSPEETEAYHREALGDRGYELKKKFDKWHNNLTLGQMLEFSERVNNFEDKLIEKHGEKICKNVIALQAILGSSPPKGVLQSPDCRFDFEGEESAEEFLDKAMKEMADQKI